MNKILEIFLNTIPIIMMIALIPLILNDFILTLVYIGIILVSLLIKYDKRDFFFLVFGGIIMVISEYFFIKTGAETFNRVSLLGIMPLWLPFLWAYAFVAIKRVVKLLE